MFKKIQCRLVFPNTHTQSEEPSGFFSVSLAVNTKGGKRLGELASLLTDYFLILHDITVWTGSKGGSMQVSIEQRLLAVC